MSTQSEADNTKTILKIDVEKLQTIPEEKT